MYIDTPASLEETSLQPLGPRVKKLNQYYVSVRFHCCSNLLEPERASHALIDSIPVLRKTERQGEAGDEANRHLGRFRVCVRAYQGDIQCDCVSLN